MYDVFSSPGSIRGGGRTPAGHKLAEICRIRLMGALVRERKCSLVASANYCGQRVGERFLNKGFPVISYYEQLKHRERKRRGGVDPARRRQRRARREQTLTVAACISAGDCRASCLCSARGRGWMDGCVFNRARPRAREDHWQCGQGGLVCVCLEVGRHVQIASRQA
jgi:hypothetical protein